MSSLPDSVENAILFYQLGIHTMSIGRVVKWEPVSRKASIQLLVNTVLKDGRRLDAPKLDNVLIAMPGTEEVNISLPIKEGKTIVMVFYAERSIEEWLNGNGDSVYPETPRSHNLNDAIAIPVPGNFNTTMAADPDDVLVDFRGESIRLKADGGMVHKSATSITLDAPQTTVTGKLSVSKDADFAETIEAVGQIHSDDDVISDNISGKGHLHTGNQGNPTSPPLP